MTFQLDTSGFVLPLKRYDPKWNAETVGYEWSDLNPFTQGYVEALFASEAMLELWRSARPAMEAEKYGSHMLWVPGFSDLAPETLARIMEDCAAFRAVYAVKVGEERLAGELLWRWRQAETLGGTDAARLPPLTPYLGDDGKVRFQ